MFIVVNKNLLIFILISIATVTASLKRQAKTDSLCGDIRSVLCVNGTLMSIATAARSIERTVNEIEKSILSKSTIVDRLNELVNSEMTSIHSHLPPTRYHLQYSNLNNIDQEYLGHLLREAHDAMSYYYNSIDDVIKMNDESAFKTDPRFEEVQLNLRSKIICPYRSVLAVYSLQWSLINQVSRIQISRGIYRHAPTIIRDVHSLIIAQLLRNWMQRLHSVIDVLDKKFY